MRYVDNMFQRVLVVFVGIIVSVLYCSGDEKVKMILRTPQADSKPNDLWCYQCDTMKEERCANLSTNHSSLYKKCLDEEYTCMVQRFSYTYSTENMTSALKMWSLQRKCSRTCEPSCIVIGERVKLFACTSCCNSSLCNTDNKGDVLRASLVLPILIGIAASTFT